MALDEFLRDIHMMVFRQWILYQKSEDYQLFVSEKNDQVIVIKTDYCHGEIVFNPMNIIELSVTNTVNDKMEFYLHFQMKTMKHAIELFEEMLETIRKLVNKPVTKVLLSCSSGLTTGFFAEQLNEAVQMLSLDYEFSAVAYSELFEVGEHYDVILLAPQISYMHARTQEILKDKIVLKIPSQIFAKYDVGMTLTFIHEEMENNKEKEKSQMQPLSLKKAISQDERILVIALMRKIDNYYWFYRVYEKETILFDNEVIKKNIRLRDICDILDTVFAQYDHINLVGISMPGIINDGRLSLEKQGFHDYDVISYLKQRYSQQFILCNDVNCVALGYYESQDQYCSLSFLYQPKPGNVGGVGSIYKGQLIEGKAHIAGEVQYLPMNLSKERSCLSKTPEGCLELVAQTVASIICLLGPEAVLVACQLICDVDDLVKEVEKYIPASYIPEIILVTDLKEYILLGQMILCVQSLQ